MMNLVALEFSLDDGGAFDDVLEFGQGEVGELQEVLDRFIVRHTGNFEGAASSQL
jgi:hypothetical protein